MSDRITSLDEIEDAEKFLKAYYKAMDETVEIRKENKELRAQVDAVSEDEVSKWKQRALRAEAKVVLEEDGIKNADRILKYLNLEGVDFDDDGNITGLDDKVDEVKKDFPELFDAKRRAGRESADIHADAPANTQKSTTEAQVDALFAS